MIDLTSLRRKPHGLCDIVGAQFKKDQKDPQVDSTAHTSASASSSWAVPGGQPWSEPTSATALKSRPPTAPDASRPPPPSVGHE